MMKLIPRMRERDEVERVRFISEMSINRMIRIGGCLEAEGQRNRECSTTLRGMSRARKIVLSNLPI